jgi:tRNA U34 5-carboxymethylaminomethyl modifying GTPase MnmE/TrmE
MRGYPGHSNFENVNGIGSSISGDLLAMDIRQAFHYLGEISSEITTDDLLSNIFSKFCIVILPFKNS